MSFDDPNSYYREEQVHNAIFEKDQSRIRTRVTNSASEPIPVTLGGVTSPNIYNISVTSANTEESQVLPDGTRSFILRIRGNGSNLKVSFTSGQSGSVFLSVPRGTSYREEGLNTSGLTIYFQTDQPSQIVELITWGG